MGKISNTDRRKRRLAARFVLVATLTGFLSPVSTFAASNNPLVHPEVDSGKQVLQQATGRESMVVTANPYATEAAFAMLQKGGTAVDAAIAAQLVLTLVEPQSSGIGGGGFMLLYDGVHKKLRHYNGRETAPLSVDENLFLLGDGKPMGFFDAVTGGLSVGTPGLMAMLGKAHSEYGKLPWRTLFEPAITLADQGFRVSERLHKSLLALFESPKGVPDKTMRNYFYQPGGQPWPVGHILKNPPLAHVLRELSNGGAGFFYQGDIPRRIVKRVKADPVQKGFLSEKDFKRYEAKVEAPLCHTVGDYRLCGSPPPSSGPFTVIEILSLLNRTPEFGGLSYDSAAFYHRLIEATKLAFADRNRYMGDPAFVRVPLKPLLSEGFQTRRVQKLPLLKASDAPRLAGVIDEVDYIKTESASQPSTTHLSIVDRAGNIVSMTTSIEHAFGSGIMVDGYLLNNQLTDFSFVPEDAAKQKVANRVQPGKRPRSSMSPMIVFDKAGNPVLVIGSPGGGWIIPYVAKTIAQYLYLHAPLDKAVTSPHITNVNRDKATLEEDTPPDLRKALEALGHETVTRPLTSGLGVIAIDKRRLTGIADPRREGTAKGI